MNLNEWLTDLAMNHRVDIINGEVCILPIMEENDD